MNHAKGTCRYCPCESIARGRRICHNHWRKRKYLRSREYRLRQQIANGAAGAKRWVKGAVALCEVIGCEPDLFWAYRRHLRKRTKMRHKLDKLIHANQERYRNAKAAERSTCGPRPVEAQGLQGMRKAVLSA